MVTYNYMSTFTEVHYGNTYTYVLFNCKSNFNILND